MDGQTKRSAPSGQSITPERHRLGYVVPPRKAFPDRSIAHLRKPSLARSALARILWRAR